VFGLSFLNSIFLAGLAAAVVPILIHLFSRRRAKEVVFPSLEYLREISHQKVRRMRLRQWILLALRVLVLALFALAMGRPVLRGSGGVVTRGSSTLAVLLDNSYSMAAADPRLSGDEPPSSSVLPVSSGREVEANGAGSAPSPVDETGTVFHAAKERAFEILDLMTEGDRGILALTGRPVALPFQTPVTDAGLLRQEVRRASLSGDRSDLPAALAQVLPILSSARTVNKELFIISDFQKQDLEQWLRASSGSSDGGTGAGSAAGGAVMAAADSFSGAIRLPGEIRVYLIPMRDHEAANAAIERLRFDVTSGTGGAGRVVASVVNHGDDPINDRMIRASAVGSEQAILSDVLFSLPPHGRADVALNLSALPRDGAVVVQLGSDALEWDNRGYLVTGEPGARKVLLVTGSVEGAGVSGENGDEGRFLRAALDPNNDAEFFRVKQVDAAALADPSVWDADVVVLTDVGRLSDQAVENLIRFRARGGGILIGLGDRVDPRYYNTTILSPLSSIELLNVVQDEGGGTYRSLRPSVASHPIFAGFPIGPGDDLGSARFRKLVTCRVGSGARVVAEFGRDAPALVEEDGLFLFTSSLDGVWNDFVTSASFPPLLHQIVRYLAGRGGSDRRAGLVGARLETILPEGSVSGPVSCLDPVGGQGQVGSVPVERMVRLRSQPAPWPGVYRFIDASGRPVASFAVNLDTNEGDLALAPVSAWHRLLGAQTRDVNPSRPIARDLLTAGSGRELWRPILVLVLILLAVESLLGRGRLLG
jgi:hypothetical protein